MARNYQVMWIAMVTVCAVKNVMYSCKIRTLYTNVKQRDLIHAHTVPLLPIIGIR